MNGAKLLEAARSGLPIPAHTRWDVTEYSDGTQLALRYLCDGKQFHVVIHVPWDRNEPGITVNLRAEVEAMVELMHDAIAEGKPA